MWVPSHRVWGRLYGLGNQGAGIVVDDLGAQGKDSSARDYDINNCGSVSLEEACLGFILATDAPGMGAGSEPHLLTICGES